ncbi:MAG: hypothetical protein JXR71_04970 [Bacteroidales bacterium]|nr:hypothetical protein [Bacteroidales bacterium]
MKKRMLSDEEFKKFFDDVVNAALTKRGASENLLSVMEKNGLSPELPPAVAEKIMPMLETNMGEVHRIPHNCSWCGVCGLCAACGELNAASAGAHSASAVHLLD